MSNLAGLGLAKRLHGLLLPLAADCSRAAPLAAGLASACPLLSELNIIFHHKTSLAGLSAEPLAVGSGDCCCDPSEHALG
jgi:hypothetical protein